MEATSPRDPRDIEQAAAKRVRSLLAGRLRRGGAKTNRPDWFSVCDPQPVEDYPNGRQVRVRTWRHWSDATVHYDSETGELLHRCIDRLADPPTDDELTREDALRAAESAVSIPPDAQLVDVRHEHFAPGHKVARLEWRHISGGLRVVGDCLMLWLHPGTRAVVSLTRRWRR